MIRTASGLPFKKQLLRLIGSFFAGLVAGFILVLVIGYLVDIAAYPYLKKMGDNALKKLEQNFTPADSNAWDYYRQAMDLVGSRPATYGLIRYAMDEAPLTDSILSDIKANQDVFDLIEKGNAQPYCIIPFEYKKSYQMISPDYNLLRDLVMLTTARALSYFHRGDGDGALRMTYSGLSFIRHLIVGTPQRYHYSWCTAYLQKQLNVLRIGLRRGAFDRHQLSLIRDYLAELEVSFPSYRWVVEGEIEIKTVRFSRIPFYVPVEFGTMGSLRKNLIGNIGNSLQARFLLWRYGFSTRFGLLSALKFWEQIIDELEKEEWEYLERTWPQDNGEIVRTNLRLYRYSRQNPLFNVTNPPLLGFFRNKTEMLTRIRLLNLAARLWLYRDDNGRFPESLSSIEDYSAVEPFTGVVWQYSWSPDSVVITSPGFNKVYGDINDLSLTLKK